MPVGFHMDLNREMWHWFSPWYLNGENGRGGQRFVPWCFHCSKAGMSPFAKQASIEHHMHHKRRVHGGNVFFHYLSIEDKRRAILALFEYRKAHDSVSSITPYADYNLECECPLSKIELQNSYVNEMHHMIADHVCMIRCPDCKLVMFETLYKGHKKHNCNIKQHAKAVA